MARAAVAAKPPVTDDRIDAALAKAVSEGDIVNFRFLFMAHSPLRQESTENIDTPKYAYLRPAAADGAAYRTALALVQQAGVRAHVRAQLARKGPPQLPSELVLALADNAVRLGKYRAAAQAYELLRVRRRMKELFFERGDAALDAGDVAGAVQAYAIATGLDYDYAAFPEPLPFAPNHQSRALMLHARYPQKPEEALAVLPPEDHLELALQYLLADNEAAARLAARSMAQQAEFADAWVRRQDPQWDAFVQRYKHACELVRKLGERMQTAAKQAEAVRQLAVEVLEQQDKLDPRDIQAAMLGRAIPEGEWWQYLKDLAYAHPASILFVSRQIISRGIEIVMPRLREGNPLAARLGLAED